MDKHLTLGVNILEAIATDDFELLEELFQQGERSYLELSPKEGWNWLHKSLLGFEADAPSRKMIEHLINKGIDVNAQDMYGMTPLHYAMRSRNVDAAIALLNAGANPNIPNQDNLIPLSMIGYLPDRLDVLELMLEKGANVHFLVNENKSILESYKPTPSEPHLSPIYELMMKYS
ncbi:ankyrin repeat domain-containing protein [Histophilus somni]|uniref:ankyrin repeat domain-containing protein n=1 Tax=Histophilus somni TaxID=731 RepID=UPI0038779B4F